MRAAPWKTEGGREEKSESDQKSHPSKEREEKQGAPQGHDHRVNVQQMLLVCVCVCVCESYSLFSGTPWQRNFI